MIVVHILNAIVILSAVIWVYLLVLHGRFWQADQRLPDVSKDVIQPQPAVIAVVPARNEADVVAQAVSSLLQQNYEGDFHVILVDDKSDDGTAALAHAAAEGLGASDRLTVLSGQARPEGWAGKVWAMSQGIAEAKEKFPEAPYLLLTDADIGHAPDNLRRLMQKAQSPTGTDKPYGLVSLMVKLHCQAFWEKRLIPAFVYFFQQLYPFPKVNDPKDAMAGAAGGCMLVRRDVLEQAGGIASIRERIIDDCALAAQIKPHAPLWLGLAEETKSLKPYDGLMGIWGMVARTAYTQLRYSVFLLIGTLFGLFLTYLAAPCALIWGIVLGQPLSWGAGLLTWLLMAISFWPTLRLYERPMVEAFTLPAIAFLYSLMTFDSAWSHWRGRGGLWKGRVAGGVVTKDPS